MELKSLLGSKAHPKPITCAAYHAARREIYTGSEDSVIRVWDTNTESSVPHLSVAHANVHSGWITAMTYCKEVKCICSAAQDGDILIWSHAGKIAQRIHTKNPIYSLCWNSRRSQLMVGHKSSVQVYQARDDFSAAVSAASASIAAASVAATSSVPPAARKQDNSSGSEYQVFDISHSVTIESHTDIVSCLASSEAYFYSASFDGSLIFYESSPQALSVTIVRVVNQAHTAGITCLSYAKDAENFWLITGSFDRYVKLWSLTGHCLHQFAAFPDTITAATYVPSTKFLWISCNSTFPIFYDPRSGVNISDFVNADNDKILSRGVAKFKYLVHVPETNEIIGTTNRRQVVVWRFNHLAPVTTLRTPAFDVLTLTQNDPILFFSGGPHLSLVQWERLHLNPFMYSREKIAFTQRKKRQPAITSILYHDTHNLLVAGVEDGSIYVLGFFQENTQDVEDDTDSNRSLIRCANRISGLSMKFQTFRHKEAVTAMVFVCKHLLISSGWDRKIFISDVRNGALIGSFHDSSRPANVAELASDGPILDAATNSSKENTECLVAFASADKMVYIRKFVHQGEQLTLRGVLQGHDAEVTQVQWYKSDKEFWVTGSEDHTIRLWDAETLECKIVINNESPVTAMAVDVVNGVFITGSRDRIVRVFDPNRLVQKHYGHTDEICAIIHVPSRNEYVSSSWDGTLRIWHAYSSKSKHKKQQSSTSLQNISVAAEEESK